MASASARLLRAWHERASGDRGRLAAAEEVAQGGFEWCQLATAWIRIADADAARRCLARARTGTTPIRIHRNIARIHRTLLDDRPLAYRALADAADDLMGRPETTSSEWTLLAAEWGLLGDRGAALDYLAFAAAHARDVAERCEVAEAHAAAGAGDLARALLERAGAAAATASEWMLIAQAYAGPLQEPARAAAALERGRAAVASVDDALVMAAAFARHGLPEAARAACLARGEALAATTADWLELDRARSFDRRGAPDPLDRAAGAAIDELDRRRALYARALRDNTPDRIAGIAVPLLPPHAILPRRGHAAWWPHDPARLLDLLLGRLDRARLDALIASNSEGSTEHTPMIEAIWRTGRVPYPMHLTAIPPLGLERWTTHESAEHAARAFACAVLCIGTAGADRPRSTHESSLAVLLDSCLALGPDAVEALIGLLVALVASYDDSPIRLFAQLGLVLAAAWRDASDPELPGQVARLIDDTARVEARLGRTEGSPHGWLYELTRFDQRHELWQSLAALILGPLITADPHLARLAALLRTNAR